MKVWMIAAAALLAVGCESTLQKPPNLTGLWGGPHAGIAFRGGLADVQFDCAAGSIDAPVILAGDGAFSVPGTYRAGSSGPVRVGQFFRSQRAVYSGTVTEKVMTLTVALEDDDKTLGPFTLTEGAPPQVTRCR